MGSNLVTKDNVSDSLEIQRNSEAYLARITSLVKELKTASPELNGLLSKAVDLQRALEKATAKQQELVIKADLSLIAKSYNLKMSAFRSTYSQLSQSYDDSISHTSMLSELMKMRALEKQSISTTQDTIKVGMDKDYTPTLKLGLSTLTEVFGYRKEQLTPKFLKKENENAAEEYNMLLATFKSKDKEFQVLSENTKNTQNYDADILKDQLMMEMTGMTKNLHKAAQKLEVFKSLNAELNKLKPSSLSSMNI